MGIYIQGMDVPKDCGECFLIKSCTGKHWEITKDDTGYNGEYVKDSCPLTEVPEPHGRLIDADWFFNTFTELANYDTEDNAPTVIEGSE